MNFRDSYYFLNNLFNFYDFRNLNHFLDYLLYKLFYLDYFIDNLNNRNKLLNYLRNFFGQVLHHNIVNRDCVNDILRYNSLDNFLDHFNLYCF